MQQTGLYFTGFSGVTNLGNVMDFINFDLAAMDADSVAELLAYHDRRYWELNSPEISDARYDQITRRLRELVPTVMVGRMEDGTIRTARASGAVMSDKGTALASGSGAAGGFVGWMENGRIDQAFASGDVLTEGDEQLGTSLGGGFAGKMVLGDVTNAIARGDVAASQAYWQYAGGFAGEVQAGRIRNAAASGKASTVGAYYSWTGGFLGQLSVLADGTESFGGTLTNVAAAGAVDGSVRAGSISFVGSNAHQGALLGFLHVSPFDGPAGTVSLAYWNAGALEDGAPLDDEDNVQYLTDSAAFTKSETSGDMVLQGDSGRTLIDTLNANIPSLGDAPEGSQWLTWTKPASADEAADLVME